MIYDTASIFEYIAENYTHLSLWPSNSALLVQASDLCAEMHSGLNAFRNYCAINIGTDLSDAGAIIWHDQQCVRVKVARIEVAWADRLYL